MPTFPCSCACLNFSVYLQQSLAILKSPPGLATQTRTWCSTARWLWASLASSPVTHIHKCAALRSHTRSFGSIPCITIFISYQQVSGFYFRHCWSNQIERSNNRPSPSTQTPFQCFPFCESATWGSCWTSLGAACSGLQYNAIPRDVLKTASTRLISNTPSAKSCKWL